VTPETMPRLDQLVRECAARLRPGQARTYIAPGYILNAYTFGVTEPRTVVVYAGMLKVMDEPELKYIVGHELGHIALGHTWLNSILGGMAGIPSPYLAAALLYFAFRWWNRACEYSADRAGVLACGKPAKAISALVKLEAGPSARTQAGLQAAMQHIASEDDDIWQNLEELLASHPMIAKRVEHIHKFSNTQEYRNMQSLMDKNLVG